jgi:hypothetical protein
MTTLIAERPMPAKRSEDKPKRRDVAVKVDGEIVNRAKIVATRKGVTLAELLSDLLDPLVARLYRDEVAKMARESGEEPPKKR